MKAVPLWLAVGVVVLGFVLHAPSVAGADLPQIPFVVDVTGTFVTNSTYCPECSVCNTAITTPGYDDTPGSDWESGQVPCPTDPSGCCTVKYVSPSAPITCGTSGFGPFSDEAQKVWGACRSGGPGCYCLTGSGIGVEGYKNLTMVSNPPNNASTNIARITHYNNGIAFLSTNLPRVMQLTFTLSSTQFPDGNAFVVSYLLYFFETPNDNGTVPCDWAIQTSGTACDDIFWFGTTATSATFSLGNAKYTLVIDGFKRVVNGDAVPRFLTPEYSVNTAYVFARLVTACDVVTCTGSSVFVGFPTCACSCPLSDAQCQELFGVDWIVDNSTCSCLCGVNSTATQQAICEAEFPNASPNTTLIWNQERCGCNCNLTDADCEAQNPLWMVAPAPGPCNCTCKTDYYVTCLSEKGRFWRPDFTNSCVCICAISDSLCEKTYGDGYTAVYSECGCTGPTSGLTGGQIAGIVIGSVAGALLLVLLAATVFGVLLCLIFKGVIPGIYGVKFEPGDLSMAQESPFYRDKWTVSNATSKAD